MPRTTADDVRDVAQIEATVSVEAYIQAATILIDDIVSCYEEVKLELLERYLAAHFAFLSGVTTAGSVMSKGIDGASVSYARSQVGQGLDGSPYGKILRQLDTKKCLTGLTDAEVSINWLGTEL